VICGADSHVFCYESGGAAALGGLVYHTVATAPDGGLDLAALARALPSPDDPHCAPAGVLTFENTQARLGGRVLDAARSRAMVELAHAHGVPVHLDGARLFNAAAALGIAAGELVVGCDSAQICLSKGLAAPIGSLLTGSAAFIERARWARKQIGGGLRQVGVLAAMGLVALDTMPARLPEDHARARRLAQGLREEASALEVELPESNIVRLRHRRLDVDRLIDAARDRGVLLTSADEVWARAVTHAGVTDEDITQAIAALATLA
jgi:threonine aldolase